MSLILTFLIRSLIWRIPGMRLVATLMVVLAAAGIFLYFFYAAGLTAIARNRKVRAPYLAWIPVASLYVLGACADDERGRRLYAPLCPALAGGALALWFTAAGDVLAAGPALAAAAMGLALTAAVFAYIALSWVYRSLSRHPVPLTVLSVIFAALIPIFLYLMRNRLPGGGCKLPDAPGD